MNSDLREIYGEDLSSVSWRWSREGKHSEGGYVDAWMASHGLAPGDYASLQRHFEARVVELVRKVSAGKKRTVLWEDNSGKSTAGLPKDAVVELWKEKHGDAHVLDATVAAGWQVSILVWRNSMWSVLPSPFALEG